MRYVVRIHNKTLGRTLYLTPKLTKTQSLPLAGLFHKERARKLANGQRKDWTRVFLLSEVHVLDSATRVLE